jgi:hypothetical protein
MCKLALIQNKETIIWVNKSNFIRPGRYNTVVLGSTILGVIVKVNQYENRRTDFIEC